MTWAFLVAQLVKNPPAMQETWVRSLGWEDLLEKGMATHSSILAWRMLYSPWGHKELDTTERLSLSFCSDLAHTHALLIKINSVNQLKRLFWISRAYQQYDLEDSDHLVSS